MGEDRRWERMLEWLASKRELGSEISLLSLLRGWHGRLVSAKRVLG